MKENSPTIDGDAPRLVIDQADPPPPVAEPATLGLLLSGVALVGLRRRR